MVSAGINRAGWGREEKLVARGVDLLCRASGLLEQLLIQGGVSQGVPPFGGPAYREPLPTQNPEDPKIARLVGFKKVRGQAAAQTGERACSISVIVLMS